MLFFIFSCQTTPKGEIADSIYFNANIITMEGEENIAKAVAVKEGKILALSQDSEVERDLDYFKQNIGSVRNADQLLADRRLLQVALTAYGLEDEIDKGAFIKRVLDEGTEASNSFANLLNDRRWSDFSEAFGFGNASSGSEKSPFQIAVELKFRPTEATTQSSVDAEDIAHFRSNIGSCRVQGMIFFRTI